MQGQHLLIPIHVPGTLTADIVFTFTMPFDGRLKELSACGSNANDATILAGISSDTNSILAEAAIGDSGVPVVYTRANFATTNPTGKLNADDVLVVTTVFGDVAGTAANDLSVLVTLLEG